MVKHERTKTTWKAKRGDREESHLILGHVARNPNSYTGAMESIRVVTGENTKTEDQFVDIRNWVESEKYTGPSKAGGIRLARHHLIELLSMLPEIKEAMEIDDDDIVEEIDERKKALSESKEE